MTEDEIRARIDELVKKHDAAVANVNALNGALQDCEFWLNRLLAQKQPTVPHLVTEPEAATG